MLIFKCYTQLFFNLIAFLFKNLKLYLDQYILLNICLLCIYLLVRIYFQQSIICLVFLFLSDVI